MGRSGRNLAGAMARAALPIAEPDLRADVRPDEAAAAIVVADHPAFRALAGALMCAGPRAAAAGWRGGERCAEIVQRIGLDPVRVRLHAETTEAAWREVVAVSPLCLDVLAVAADRSAAGEVRLVRCDEVLAARGRRRWGEERHALEDQIARELVRLGRITVGPGDQALFSVMPVGSPPRSFVLGLDPAVRELWAQAAPRTIHRRLLQFDHRSNRGADVLAKKLGFHFSLITSGERPTVRQVRCVLKAIGAAPELARGARTGRLADRFEEAVLRLNENGLFAAAYRGGRNPAAASLRVKGWIKGWLDAELVIERRR